MEINLIFIKNFNIIILLYNFKLKYQNNLKIRIIYNEYLINLNINNILII